MYLKIKGGFKKRKSRADSVTQEAKKTLGESSIFNMWFWFGGILFERIRPTGLSLL